MGETGEREEWLVGSKASVSKLETDLWWKLFVEPVMLRGRFATFNIKRAFLANLEQGFLQPNYPNAATISSSAREAFTSQETASG